MSLNILSKQILKSAPPNSVFQIRSSRDFNAHLSKRNKSFINLTDFVGKSNRYERKLRSIDFTKLNVGFNSVIGGRNKTISTSLMRTSLGQRYYSTNQEPVTVNVPRMGESVSSGVLGSWLKNKGDFVEMDEVVASIDTDKISVEIRSPVAGVLSELYAEEGDTIAVDEKLFTVIPSEKSKEPSQPKQEEPQKTPTPEPEVTKTTTTTTTPPTAPPSKPKVEEVKARTEPTQKVTTTGERIDRRVKMSQARKRIAQRMKDSQNTYALLTTFNEVDMHNVMQMRKEHQDEFLEKHGIKLGFMSVFAKASAIALMENPIVNAVIDGDEIIYRDYVDISIAVSTPTNLFVPVLRNVEQMSFADIEREIANFGKKAREGKISIEDMAGGTFTISNGGVFGSLFGTPIVNPPQSAILGMHAIKKKPVVIDDKIEIRPMMYLALTYDHRLIDGRDAVTTLKRIKELVEDPIKILLN